MVKAVIGCNYGDEGKGLVTEFLCREAFNENKSVLNVLTNGGCQRGHTVNHNGERRIYSHLGSGFTVADIMFSQFYMINPMIFCHEYDDYIKTHPTPNKIYVDSNCTLTTPYDMLVNRALEDRRTNKHGSCGYGIYETTIRNAIYPLYWKDLCRYSTELIRSKLLEIRDIYFKEVLANYNITLNDKEKEIYFSNNLLNNFIEDISRMRSLTIEITYEYISALYDEIVFENAQGLLLDMDVDPWGTPSKTGLFYVKDIVGDKEIIPYYVTRSYLTKHGNGNFPGECNKVDINPAIVDLTNQPNKYQGTLRYGKFSRELADELLARVQEDAKGYHYKIVVTHQNEYQCKYISFADYYSYNEDTIEKA